MRRNKHIGDNSCDSLFKELGERDDVGQLMQKKQESPHAEHGRGMAEDGPDDPDCPCRGTRSEQACAATGCEFCNRNVPARVEP